MFTNSLKIIPPYVETSLTLCTLVNKTRGVRHKGFMENRVNYVQRTKPVLHFTVWLEDSWRSK